MGIASLISGIMSIVMLLLMAVSKWIIDFGALPSVAAIIAIILGIMDIREKQKIKENYNKSLIGIILGSIYVIIFSLIAISSISSTYFYS